MEQLISSLANSGPVWTLLAISISLNWFLINKVFNLQEKRVDEAQKVRDELVAPIKSIDDSLSQLRANSPSFQDMIKMVKGESK